MYCRFLGKNHTCLMSLINELDEDQYKKIEELARELIEEEKKVTEKVDAP